MKHPFQKISTHPVTGRTVVDTVNKEKSITQQQFKDECDINNIMAKYQKTGEFTGAIRKGGQYGDFSQITDFHDMQNTLIYAQEAFMLLPANVRTRFRNDPGELLNFLQDENNYDEALDLGLLDPDKQRSTPEKTKNEPKQTNKKTGASTSKTPESDPSLEE